MLWRSLKYSSSLSLIFCCAIVVSGTGVSNPHSDSRRNNGSAHRSQSSRSFPFPSSGGNLLIQSKTTKGRTLAFGLIVENKRGQRTGFTTEGTLLKEIEESTADMSIAEGDGPDSESTDNPDKRYGISVPAAPELKLTIIGARTIEYEIEVSYWARSQPPSSHWINGKVEKGSQKKIQITRAASP